MIPRTGIYWNYYDNRHPDQVLGQIKQYLARRIGHPDCQFFYYGQTDDPETRFAQHQKEMRDLKIAEWDMMEVVYGHRSLGFATMVENALISHFREHPKYDAGGLNTAGTRYEGARKFYVYVLIDDHPDGGAKSVKDEPDQETWIYKEGNKRANEALRDETVVKAFEKAILVGGPGTRRPAKLFYVGITNLPRRRLLEHQRIFGGVATGNPWEEMRVIYQTPALENAVRAETLLIEHARRKYADNLQNLSPGRFSKLMLDDGTEMQPQFYVYYLEDRKI